jgi:hypothetical protein
MNCFYCKNELSSSFSNNVEICYICPSQVKHFVDGAGRLYCVEISYQSNVVAHYFDEDRARTYISIKAGLKPFTFKEKLDITPTNIKEKIQLILTFQ